MATDTKRFPVSLVNRALTVELVNREIRRLPSAWDAMALLMLLINKRSNGEGPWIEVTGVEWQSRTGARKDAKGRAARSLEGAGLLLVQRDGLRSLRFRLAPRVDPRSKKCAAAKLQTAGAGPKEATPSDDELIAGERVVTPEEMRQVEEDGAGRHLPYIHEPTPDDPFRSIPNPAYKEARH